MHDCILAQLGPHEIHLVNGLIFAEKPPKATLEKCPNHHRIVPFAHEALIVRVHEFVGGCCCNLLVNVVEVLDSILVNLFLELGASVIAFRVQQILPLQNLAYVKDELLFDCIRIFTNPQSLGHQLIFGQLYAQSSSKFDGVGNVLQSLLFRGSRSKYQLAEFVVVSQHTINRMHQVLLILIQILDNFDLGWRVSVRELICEIFSSLCQRGTCERL